VNRIRKISLELMTTYKGKFDKDFAHNKQVLNEVAIVRSKGLKNEIAGYISTYIKRELEAKQEKESEAVAHNEPVDETEEIEEQILN
jgi:small subunit ribosomal protein S17e